MAKLATIEGIGATYAGKMAECGVTTTAGLLKAGADPAGRKKLAAESGLTEKQILGWVNRADLMRVKGVGEEYSDLLECAGVDTCVELATRNPQNLQVAMSDLNEEKKLVRRPPSRAEVQRWVAHAKELDRVITY